MRDKEGKPYTVRYDQVNAMLLNEFLKEHRTVTELKKEISALTAMVKEQAERIRGLGRYGEVLNVYMEEPPLVSDWPSLTKTRDVVVVPFFISDGLHSYEDIPVLLGIDGKGPGPHELHGRSIFYSTAIGTDSRFADVIIEQAASFDQRKQVLQSLP